LYIAHALLADSSEKFSLARLLEQHVRVSVCGEKINANEEHRISILFLFRTQMDMYIHGKKTDFGVSIPLFVSFYLWLNFIAGTKIACSLVLKLVA
jgi:hypothetical protein